MENEREMQFYLFRKYLVEKGKIDPSQILVISFTNKAVNELKWFLKKKKCLSKNLTGE